MKVRISVATALCAAMLGGLTAVAQTEQPGLKSITAGDGWTVYDGGVYRYGPSMIINDDGSMDAYFAAPGQSYTKDDLDYGTYTTNEAKGETSYYLCDIGVAAQLVASNTPFYAIAIKTFNEKSYGNDVMNVKAYEWKGDYASTVAGSPIYNQDYKSVKNGGWVYAYSSLAAANDDTKMFAAGKYLWVVTTESTALGIWYGDKSEAVESTSFAEQAVSDKAWVSRICYSTDQVNPVVKGNYWDQLAYRHSTDGGHTYGPESMTVKPTFGSRDAFSCCDPGVCRWGGYYYIGYTSTENSGGIDNHVYMARSKNPNGPWEKWNGAGWGGSNPQPVIEYTGDHTKWGAGEPSMVVVGNTVYLYYTWDDNGLHSTKLATAPADDPNWPAQLQDKGVVINKNSIDGSDSGDFKYVDAIKKFICVFTASRMTADSYMLVYESADGINFSRVGRVEGIPKQGIHNCGISGDERGHIDLTKNNVIAYAWGIESWGSWQTFMQPITFDYVPAAVDDITADKNKLDVTVDGNVIVVAGGKKADVINLQGQTVGAGVSRMEVTPGIYVVKAGNLVTKVAVR